MRTARCWVLRDAKPSTRVGRTAALTVYFQFLVAVEVLTQADNEPHPAEIIIGFHDTLA
jgi:hypothetical protein